MQKSTESIKTAILPILLLVAACGGERVITKFGDNFFADTSYTNNFDKYRFELRTKDSVYSIINPRLSAGYVKAGTIKQFSDTGSVIVFVTRQYSKQILKPVPADSSGAKTNQIQFAQYNIDKVEIYHPPTPSSKADSAVVFIAVICLVGIFLFYTLALQDFLQSCYIATMVYGSYNAPEVLVLRRFRDEKLMKNTFGRSFVAFYYAASPTFVKLFRNNRTVNNFCKCILDSLVERLEKQQKHSLLESATLQIPTHL